jgi:maleate isomerase
MEARMAAQLRIGMLTPSSNTVLEPLTQAMLAATPDITAHFSRFRVTEISLSEGALAQFDDRPILAAAELLADARVDVIAWNGTSAAWRGFDTDVQLCERITQATGVAATSSILALNEVLRKTGADFGLMSPYLADVQDRIVANYAGIGMRCRSERHLGIQENFAFSTIPPETIARLVREVAAERPSAIATVCTNMAAAPLTETLEAELGVPIFDTTALALWKSLSLAGADPSRIVGWGSLFRLA